MVTRYNLINKLQNICIGNVALIVLELGHQCPRTNMKSIIVEHVT